MSRSPTAHPDKCDTRRGVRADTIAPIQRSSSVGRSHPGVSRSSGPVFRTRPRHKRCDDMEASILCGTALLVLQVRMMREDLLAVQVLGPEACRRDHVLAPRRQNGSVRQREEGNAFEVDLLDRDLLFERPICDEVSPFVKTKPRRAPEQDLAKPGRTRFLLLGSGRATVRTYEQRDGIKPRQRTRPSREWYRGELSFAVSSAPALLGLIFASRSSAAENFVSDRHRSTGAPNSCDVMRDDEVLDLCAPHPGSRV